MILTIARREISALFGSPMAWIIAATLQLVFAWMFMLTLEDYLQAQPQLALQDNPPGITAFLAYRYMAPVSTFLLLVCPILTMRSFADEFRLNTYALLGSAPVSLVAIVLGKFLGVFSLILALTILVVLMPLSLIFVSGISFATVLIAWTGIVLLAATASAIGLFFSSLTQHSTVAALCSLATLLFLWLLGKGNFSHTLVHELFFSIALSAHLSSFFQGIVETGEIFYFLTLTALFLLLTLIRLDSYRQAGMH